jgi:hypothetical protein
MISITEAEIVEALEAAKVEVERPPNALTTVELGEVLGIGYQAATRRIRAAVKAGTLECVRVRLAGMDGVVRPQPAYRPVAKVKR